MSSKENLNDLLLECLYDLRKEKLFFDQLYTYKLISTDQRRHAEMQEILQSVANHFNLRIQDLPELLIKFPVVNGNEIDPGAEQLFLCNNSMIVIYKDDEPGLNNIELHFQNRTMRVNHVYDYFINSNLDLCVVFSNKIDAIYHLKKDKFECLHENPQCNTIFKRKDLIIKTYKNMIGSYKNNVQYDSLYDYDIHEFNEEDENNIYFFDEWRLPRFKRPPKTIDNYMFVDALDGLEIQVYNYLFNQNDLPNSIISYTVKDLLGQSEIENPTIYTLVSFLDKLDFHSDSNIFVILYNTFNMFKMTEEKLFQTIFKQLGEIDLEWIKFLSIHFPERLLKIYKKETNYEKIKNEFYRRYHDEFNR